MMIERREITQNVIVDDELGAGGEGINHGQGNRSVHELRRDSFR